MKVLNCILDNRFGGPQKRAYTVANKLQKHGIQTLFLFDEKIKGKTPFRGMDCFLIRHTQCLTQRSTTLNALLFSLLFLYNLYSICSIIKSERINIVHVNGIMNILPALSAKLTGVKVLWHLNDTSTPRGIRRLLLPLVKLFSHTIAVAGKKTGEHYFGLNNSFFDKTTVLYAPVDTDKFNSNSIDAQITEALKDEFNIHKKFFVVGILGNINRAKGYEYFIKAAKMIKKKMDNVQFLVVGAKLETQKDYWKKLKALISDLDLTNDIIFAGFREDVPEALSCMDVFVLSSITEACPISVLEAMAMNVPIVATDVGCVSEQVIADKTGIIVNPKNPEAIAAGVLRFLKTSPSEKDKMIMEGRKRAEEIFALDKVADKHRKIYESMIVA